MHIEDIDRSLQNYAMEGDWEDASVVVHALFAFIIAMGDKILRRSFCMCM